MKREDVNAFQGKNVKLVKSDGYVLFGIIDMVNEDSILFSTKQAQSLIKFEDIKNIVLKKKEVSY